MNDNEDTPEFPFPEGTYVLIHNYDGETDNPWNGKMVRFTEEGYEWDPDSDRWLFKAKPVEGHELEGYVYDQPEPHLIALFAEEMIEADLVPSLNKVW